MYLLLPAMIACLMYRHIANQSKYSLIHSSIISILYFRNHLHLIFNSIQKNPVQVLIYITCILIITRTLDCTLLWYNKIIVRKSVPLIVLSLCLFWRKFSLKCWNWFWKKMDMGLLSRKRDLFSPTRKLFFVMFHVLGLIECLFTVL